MRLLCLLTKHQPIPSNIWNDGYYFSRCSGCDCEMIGRGGRWQSIPRGFKVVWRPRDGATNWAPWATERADAARLSDMLMGSHEESIAVPTGFGPASGSVVEGLHARAASG